MKRRKQSKRKPAKRARVSGEQAEKSPQTERPPEYRISKASPPSRELNLRSWVKLTERPSNAPPSVSDPAKTDPDREAIELKVEEHFLELAKKLVMDDKWERYHENWSQVHSNLKRSGFLEVLRHFSWDYCSLLEEAVVEYSDLRTRSTLSKTANKKIEWQEILAAAFKFAERFTAGEYEKPWNGTFVLPRRPTDKRPQGPIPDFNAIMDFQRIQTAWFEKEEPVSSEELLKHFSREVRSGDWRQHAEDQAKNEFRLHVELQPEAPSQAKQKDPEPDIVKRRAIVKQNHGVTARGMCELFDSNKIPLPRRMAEARTWVTAYMSDAHRPAIDTLIYRDRQKVAN